MQTKALLIVTSASMLFGCFNFKDGDDSNDDDTVVTTSMSGKVADGYLTGAKVCLDLNSNKVCDEGEPSTTSTNGGEFSLDGVTQAQLDSAPLLVEIFVGETIDEDNPGVTINKKYTLTAPAGYAFISPLTTMVQSEIEESGSSPEEAAGSVQAKLGTTLDLEADYVAGSESGSNADEFKRLHKVAQVTVVVLQNNLELVKDVLANADVSFEDLIGLIVSQVLNSLDTISGEVTSAGENFNPTTIAASDQVSEANVNPATVEDDISEREAARLIATANIAAVLASGDSLHFFDSDKKSSSLEFSYGTVSLNNSAVVITKTLYEGGSWIAETDSEDDTDQICVLENAAWNCVDEESETIVIEGDAVIIKTGGLEVTRSEITGVSVDLSGKRIQTFLDDEEFLLVTDAQANFSSGSTGYKLSFKRTKDMFVIFKENADTTTDCKHNENATDIWCNNVRLRTGDGNYQTDIAAATTLNSLISATAAVNPTDPSQVKGTSIYGGESEIIAEFVTGGVANFYKVNHTQSQSMIETNMVGSWKEEIVDGKALLSFTLPPILIGSGDFDSDEHSQFFTVEDGYVRRGGIDPTGERGDNEWIFNDSGRDQILAAFDYNLLVGLSPCTASDVDFQEDNIAKDPGATAAEFITAATNCNTVNFTANELVNTTLVTKFGFLNFKTVGTGVFLGEVGDKMNAVLNFTWAVNSNGHIVVSTSSVEDGEAVHLRLTLAKIEKNARQISLKSFSQEAKTAAGLSSVKGSIEGEVWGLN